MALVRTFLPLEGERISLHQEVEAKYSAFEKDGRAFVQINTYGRPDRKFPEKVSQTIQLDRDAARQLVGILNKAFGVS